MFEKLELEPAIQRPELVPECVMTLLQNWRGTTPVERVLVAPIDPEFSDSAQFCERYSVPPELGANCVVVEAVRGENRILAACLVPIHTRADLNKTAKKLLDVKRVSFAPLPEVLELTGMEFGGITPVGLPDAWPKLIDSRVIAMDQLIVGSGYRKSKLLVPGAFLAELPGVRVVENLGQ